jgi:3-oxoacyl-[acyl-carrier protein] reductase
MTEGAFDGQVAIVTGSTRGIGRATAELLAREGAHVLVHGRDPKLLEEVTEGLSGSGLAACGDITLPEMPERLVQTATDAWGRLDVLVNNAGFTWDCRFTEMSDVHLQAMLDVHLVAPVRMLRAAAPYLLAGATDADVVRGRRKVVNVSSVAGTMGSAGQANYDAAKAALVGLTKGLAKEWGESGVNVNAVAPGFIDTRLTGSVSEALTEGHGRLIALGISDERLRKGIESVPMRRRGSAEEVADAIVFLCSPRSDYVHGQVLTVSGGFAAGMER